MGKITYVNTTDDINPAQEIQGEYSIPQYSTENAFSVM